MSDRIGSPILVVPPEKIAGKDNKLTLVATDGRRLALVDLEVEFPSSQETEIIFRRRQSLKFSVWCVRKVK